jgi:predicted metal-dependent hydrolase
MDRTTARMLMDSLNRDAARIAIHFSLTYKSVEPERANVKSRYGVCYSDGLIKIRLRHAATGRPLKYSSLVSTLCHELAHLRHFNHGLRFRAFNQELMDFARAQGIYRPRSESPPADAAATRQRPRQAVGPAQLELFLGSGVLTPLELG